MPTQSATPATKPNQDDRDQGPQVHFTSLSTNAEASFKGDWDKTLSQLWDAAATNLNEPRRAGDELQCGANDQVLTPYLGLTLRAFHEQHVCAGFHFEIRGPAGGAKP